MYMLGHHFFSSRGNKNIIKHHKCFCALYSKVTETGEKLFFERQANVYIELWLSFKLNFKFSTIVKSAAFGQMVNCINTILFIIL